MIDLASDPLAQAFRFDGGPKGCLLLHGFTGSPGEMRPLGERLAASGYSVSAPLLPGHASTPADLARTRWEDWFAAAASAWNDLSRLARIRAVAGLSMGSLLALHLAHERPAEVKALALLAPPIELRNQRRAEHALWLARLPWLPRRLSIVPKRGESQGGGPGRKTPAYDEVPIRALASMIELQRRVRGELADVHAPALIVDGGSDLTIAPQAAAIVESGLGSPIKRRLHCPRSGHVLTEDVDAQEVVSTVERFFAEVLPQG